MSEIAAAPRDLADRRMADALRASGLPDPRGRFREWLRSLKNRDDSAFRAEVEYFEQRVVPATDAIEAWTEYGLRLARRLAPGEAVRIDPSGRRHAWDGAAPLVDLILYLPSSTRDPAVVVREPAHLSPAQQATVWLLVDGRLALDGG